MSKAGADIEVESWVSEFRPCPRFGHLPYINFSSPNPMVYLLKCQLLFAPCSSAAEDSKRNYRQRKRAQRKEVQDVLHTDDHDQPPPAIDNNDDQATSEE